MAAKSEFRKYVDSTQALPPDVVLGNLVWMTVVDGAYNLDEVTRTFDDLGLNSSLLPQPTTAFNAFEKACTKAQQSAKPYELPADRRTRRVGQIMAIRESMKNPEQVTRHVIREIRDDRSNRLAYDSIAELTLYRPQPGKDGRIDRSRPPRTRAIIHKERLLTGEIDEVRAVIEKWNTEFDRLYNYVDGDKMRGVVREYLSFLNAVMMKNGVYFVHKSREDDLNRLRAFVSKLPGNNILELMPIPEIKRLRESVIEAYQDEAVKELNEVLADIQKVRSSRETITSAAVIKLTDKYQQVMRKATEYTRTLHCDQQRTAGAAEMVMAALDSLREELVST